jgi:Asp/Glu/hydantoin racemase
MRIALVNPNTSPESTAAFAAIARAAAAPGTEIVPLTGAFGARLMMTPAEQEIGAHAALAALAEHASTCDAAIIAAFGDMGVAAARDLFRIPVLSMAEAALKAAGLAGQPFAMITIARSAVPRMWSLARTHGVAERLTDIHVLEPIPDSEAYARRTIEFCAQLAAGDAGELVVLSGPPLSALYPRLKGKTALPLIEGAAAAVRLLEAIVGLGVKPIARAEREPMIAPELSGLPEPLIEAIRRRSRRGLS